MDNEITVQGEVYVKKSSIKEKEVTNIDADSPYEVGKNYFIRTVTNYYTGRLVGVGEKELILEDASWVADTRSFHDFVNIGDKDDNIEYESFAKGRVIIGRGAIIDASIWIHELLKGKK